MANEIKFMFLTGYATLEADVLTPAGEIRSPHSAIGLTENDNSRPISMYLGDAANIVSGDTIVVYDSNNNQFMGGEVYKDNNDSTIAAATVISAGYIGDYKLGETLYFAFSTLKTFSAGSDIRVYKNSDGTQLGTAQATVTRDGLETNVHSVSIVLSDTNYDKDEDYQVVLSGATIGGETVSAVVALFSIENRWQEPKHRWITP